MSYALVTHTTTNTTSAGVDTTGASLIVVAVLEYNGQTFTAPSDNKGNTYTALTASGVASGANVKLYYCANPTAGTGHTFTNNCTEFATQGFFSEIAVAAFSGALTVSPFDQQNQHASGGGPSTVQPGSVTPGVDNELVVTGVAIDAIKSLSIDGGYTITDTGTTTGGASSTLGLAYLVQTTAAATNPTWTLNTSNSNAIGAAIATFKAAAGGGGVTGSPVYAYAQQ